MLPQKKTAVSRRAFIRDISFATLLLAGGGAKALTRAEFRAISHAPLMRFAVASDAHYGQPKTAFDAMIEKLTAQVNLFHQGSPLDFCVINGDLIHNERSLLPQVKQQISKLSMPWQVTRGNHDMVTEEEWKNVFGTPLNHDMVIKETGIILGDTSNEKGTYLAPDLVWLKQCLDKHSDKKNVFLFLHIPQAKWTANGIDTPAFFELVEKYPNLKAVFHGHEHDQDGVRFHKQLPFLFDSHIGGNWGTDYKGFRVVEVMADGSMLTYMMNPETKFMEQWYHQS